MALYSGIKGWYKRLEKHRFKWPNSVDTPVAMDSTVLNRLLDGYDIRPPKGHPTLNYTTIT